MLEKLAEKHNIWIKMVRSLGCDKHTSEDIVQSMYLRIHQYVKDEKKIMYNDDEINTFFIYVTLKNMYKTYKTSNSKFQFFDIREDESVEELRDEFFDLAMDQAFDRLIFKIKAEMETWHKYDKLLSEKYFKTNYSLRDISDGTGISLTSIFNSIKNNKKLLKEKFGEDWEDFKNGDYNLI